jgi:hypothetical protein|tara:strand:- start:92 stop:316 length:225 start_codon:yes stop_codon:yes gene_type:complete
MSKRYKLKYHLALDLGNKYKDYPDLPEFYCEQEAKDYWDIYKRSNFIIHKEPVVIIRKEVSITEIKVFVKDHSS